MSAQAYRALDVVSLVVEVDASTSLAALETALRNEGLTLDVADVASRGAVGAWLAAGAAGSRDPFRDPADHLLTGLDATMANGAALSVRPGPRRAVGPDLVALFVGCHGRFGTIERAWLRVHRIGVKRPDTAPFATPGETDVSDGEARLLDAIARELTTPSR